MVISRKQGILSNCVSKRLWMVRSFLKTTQAILAPAIHRLRTLYSTVKEAESSCSRCNKVNNHLEMLRNQKIL